MNCTKPRVSPSSPPLLQLMTKCRLALVLAVIWATRAGAVYAPVPEEDLGQTFTVNLVSGVYHDSNIFGGATDEISSLVYRVAPSLAVNSSVSAQTFLSAGYDFTYDYVQDRPQNTDLLSHNFHVRLAHAFSERSTLDLNEAYAIAQNPESLLAGVPLNTDQSFKSNLFNAIFTGGLTQRLGFTFKGRSTIFNYDLANLAALLNRHEVLLGVSGDYAVSAATKLSGEYRFQDVAYRTGGAAKDKQSHYFLGGLDYAPSEKVSLSVRLGWENRQRSGAADEDAPYAEVIGRYAYGEHSYVSAGYIHAVEENSNVDAYTDTQVDRFFINLQHAFTAQTTGSLFYDLEPSTLNGRAGVSPDRSETIQRTGLAVTYQPRRHWTVSATADFDLTQSDDPNRDQQRNRIGLDVRYAF